MMKVKIEQNDLQNKAIEIDTLDVSPLLGIYYLNIVRNGTLGNFSVKRAVMKKGRLNDFIYLIENANIVESKDYVCQVESGNAYGWFYKENGK